MDAFCFCTDSNVHDDDYDDIGDYPDGGVIDNDDIVVDHIHVERELDRAHTKLENVPSAVAHGMQKNKPNAQMNAVLYKLSLIGVKDTTILQQRLPTLNQRLQNMDLPAFHRATLAAGRNTTHHMIGWHGFARPSSN